MTSVRPESDPDFPYAHRAYGDPGTFEAAVEQLADPLNDPLPGQQQAPVPVPVPEPVQQPQEEWYDPQGYQQEWYGYDQQPQQAQEYQQLHEYQQPHQYEPPQQYEQHQQTYQEYQEYEEYQEHQQYSYDPEAPEAPEALVADDETVGLRPRVPEPVREPVRRAPGSRLEARRAERAKRPGPAVVASRVIGELFITFGVLMLLFVTYQLWWTNIAAGIEADKERSRIEKSWADGKGKPDAFEPGQGFAMLHIPKLDVVVPVAEGISKKKVLDRGMVGHYAEKGLKTAMPEEKEGNFAVAGHRNTHGEPFRYINRLKPGDPIIVETQDTYYVYEMANILPQTSPSNIDVIAPVPKESGFDGPGRYITLTTCTPEFTSTYRMIVWGKIVDERPRSEGKPKALVR
ncbi:class E sortase [Streptomyces sp. E11-3]|uniref:class E sortase n=1 Tax=Streptomyces sp. E11-3 TaxID=3110112 RepID=UPI00397EF491